MYTTYHILTLTLLYTIYNHRNSRLCQQLHDKWFDLREEYERYLLHIDTNSYFHNKKGGKLIYNGMCKGYDNPKKNYIPIPAVLTD